MNDDRKLTEKWVRENPDKAVVLLRHRKKVIRNQAYRLSRYEKWEDKLNNLVVSNSPRYE
jgi:hypothetical protein